MIKICVTLNAGQGWLVCLLKAYSPTNRTGSPQGFYRTCTCQNLYNFFQSSIKEKRKKEKKKAPNTESQGGGSAYISHLERADQQRSCRETRKKQKLWTNTSHNLQWPSFRIWQPDCGEIWTRFPGHRLSAATAMFPRKCPGDREDIKIYTALTSYFTTLSLCRFAMCIITAIVLPQLHLGDKRAYTREEHWEH